MSILRKRQNFFLSAIILLATGFVFFLDSTWKQSRIKRLLKEIPTEEQYFLESFFRILISCESGNFVLFGDKPTSVMFYEDWKNLKSAAFVRRNSSFTDFSPEKKGFAVWQKYQSKFPFKNYAIIKTRSFFSEVSEAIFLIHKKRLLKILEQNFMEFKTKFPRFISPKNLLDNMLGDSSFLHEVCFKSDFLLGIILGYGRENAALFERENEIKDHLFPRKSEFLEGGLYLKKPIPRKGFMSLEEEFQDICAKGDGVIDPNSRQSVFLLLNLPIGYLVDTTQVNLKKLRQKYNHQLIASTEAYSKGNYLETTLYHLSK